ncbi:hypothetical protein [Flavobacterium facile]|uniref:hypothetical protein n=1 Tax=Flavobacterium facile TaxID=2893174 RepID=UPI002E76E8C5|nr:hypothetical protein [Flavobacterium sp. T-12]
MENTNKTDDLVLDTSAIVGYLDDNALAALKTKNKLKNVTEVITEDEDGVKHATYFKKPELEHLELLAKYTKKEEAIKGLQILFNTCRVAGSDEVLTDDEMRSAAYQDLAKIFKKRETIVKKR